MNQSDNVNEKVIQKLEVAVEYMKTKISDNDKNKKSKIAELDNLLTEVRNLVDAKRRMSLKKGSNNQLSVSRFANQN